MNWILTRYGIMVLILILLTNSFSELSRAGTIYVPSQQPTIQAGIDAAVEGDTVLVAPGTYTGDGNRDIDFEGKNILLKSETGPEETIIDCEGSVQDPHRAFWIHNNENELCIVDGFTITNGMADSFGGAILCSNASPKIQGNVIDANSAIWSAGFGIGLGGGIASFNGNPVIIGNVIRNCEAGGFYGGRGGGISCMSGAPQITGNIIEGNIAPFGSVHDGGGGWGAAIYCDGICNPAIIGNTIVRNRDGGLWDLNPAITLLHDVQATVENNLIAYNENRSFGPAGDFGQIVMTCNNIFGNKYGDYIEPITDQEGIYGNFSANPLFCDTIIGDYHIGSASPCAPDNTDEGVLVGALGVGCDGGYLCGDATGDYSINVGDPVYLISYIFRGGPPPFAVGAGDANCDDNTDVGDAVYLINYIFNGGEEPCCP